MLCACAAFSDAAGPYITVKTRQGLVTMNLEDYLVKVVSAETWPGWHMEALKAQAVASRSYALRKKLYSRKTWDVRGTVQDQVIRDSIREDALKAVKETEGLVLTYRGEPIMALFHSTCGGGTTTPDRVWPGKGAPYLKAVACKYCRISPRYRWESKLKVEDARRRLQRLGLRRSWPMEISPLDPDEVGRCSKVRIGGRRGMVVSAQELRQVLGYDVLRSAIFKARVHGDELVITGRGSGHGVGMCQWGAEGMAREGRRFSDILQHYYPGTSLVRAY